MLWPFVLKKLVVLVIPLIFFVPHASAASVDQVRVTSVDQQDTDQDGRPDETVVNYWFEEKRSRITVYDAGNDMQISNNWEVATDFLNDVWLFDTRLLGMPELIVRFTQENDKLVALIYQDTDNDGQVAYQRVGKDVQILESQGHWKVKVVTPTANWRTGSGSLSMNLRFLVDGHLQEEGLLPESFLQTLQQDGHPDFEYEIVDANYDGVPEYQVGGLIAPSPRNAAMPRTALHVNSGRKRPALPNSYLFWPLLGSAQSAPSVDTRYFDTAPFVQFAWPLARVQTVGIAGYPIEHGYHVNNLNYWHKQRLNQANFESPMAYYDLAKDRDNNPELFVRVAYFPKNDPYNPTQSNTIATQDVRYVWNQENHSGLRWDYGIGLAGTHEITSVVEFEDFGVQMLGHEMLPSWVKQQDWAYATFVAVEDGEYISSEGIYEWSALEGVVVDQTRPKDDATRDVANAQAGQLDYLLGIENTDPQRFYTTIRQGLRGEYADLQNGRTHLYFSPVDHKLHLSGAAHGVWTVNKDAEIRYANLNGDNYLDQWTYAERVSGSDGITVTQQLNVARDHAVYSDQNSVVLRRAAIEPSVFEAAPPATTDEWQALSEQIKKQERSFTPNDLQAMLRQFPGSELQIDGATLRDYRATADGFRFVVTLEPGFKAQGSRLFDVRDLQPGEYAVTYDGTFHVEPLTPPQVEATIDQASFTALQPNAVSIALHNAGREDVSEALIELWTASDGTPATLVATDTVALLSQGTVTATLAWTPPAAGVWSLSPHVQLPDQPATPLATTEHTVLAAGAASPKEMVVISTSASTRAGMMLGLMGLAFAAAATFWYLGRSQMNKKDAA